MENFPVEIIEKIVICPELSIKDILNLSLTCKTFREIIRNNNIIWKNKFFQRWPQLQCKLESDIISYYQELCHVIKLIKRTREILETMPEEFYKKVELCDGDMAEWDKIIKEKWDNIHYLTVDLMNIIHTKREINYYDVVPLNTPGNLTQIYYANKVLRYIRQVFLTRMWEKFITLPPERQILEVGAVIVAQWCLPSVDINSEEIYGTLDEIAEKVKEELRRDQSELDHPLFKATKEQFELWRREIRPDNEWCPNDCRKIMTAMREVIFRQLAFNGYANRGSRSQAPSESDIYLNLVLKTRKGMAIPLAIIFEGVGRRLGLRFEPIVFPSHFLLRFCESQHPNADWYYIDICNGGEIIRQGVCPFSNKAPATRPKYPMATARDVISNLAQYVEHLARESYSPSGQVTRLRSALELLHLINPQDISAIFNLARLYMLHNMDTSRLKHFVSTHDFDDQAQAASLRQMLQNYQAYPPDGPIVPVKRPPEVKFAIGMVMRHLLYGYHCVIFNWDAICLAALDWQQRNNINSLRFQGKQPYYNVFVEDGSHRYVAQENLIPIFLNEPLQLNDEVGRHFSHFHETYYVPNAETEYHYPEDRTVRFHYHKLNKSGLADLEHINSFLKGER